MLDKLLQVWERLSRSCRFRNADMPTIFVWKIACIALGDSKIMIFILRKVLQRRKIEKNLNILFSNQSLCPNAKKKYFLNWNFFFFFFLLFLYIRTLKKNSEDFILLIYPPHVFIYKKSIRFFSIHFLNFYKNKTFFFKK